MVVVGWWGGGVVGVFLYLLIRGVPVAMATIVHYVHYIRLRVPFFDYGRGVSLVGIMII